MPPQTYEGFAPTEFGGEGALWRLTIRRKGTDEHLELPVRAAFIAIGFQPNSLLVSHLAELNERREIIINPDCSTTCPGVFAAGDVSSGYGKRIVVACGEGAKAAMAARQYLLELRKRVSAGG